MWQRLQIRGFRALEQFELGDLGRINLLVGENNSGKTSVLEAIELLAAGGDASALWSIAARRGERAVDAGPGRAPDERVDIKHLFFNHQPGALEVNAESGRDGNAKSFVRIKCSQWPSAAGLEQTALAFHGSPDAMDGWATGAAWNWLLHIRSSKTAPRMKVVPLVGWGELLRASRQVYAPDEENFENHTELRAAVESILRLYQGVAVPGPPPPQVPFVTTQSLQPARAVELFNRIALNPEENLVIEALQTIEPTIERIASVASFASDTDPRGGLVIKRRGIDHRIPIGSMGDGIWRLLGIILCLIDARDGVLLIDEIDTGLHHSVLSRMWKLVMATAERLNVQVFATTHSRDCYESLAVICREEATAPSQVSLQRIDRGKSRAVAFTEAEIIRAAERGIEVR